MGSNSTREMNALADIGIAKAQARTNDRLEQELLRWPVVSEVDVRWVNGKYCVTVAAYTRNRFVQCCDLHEDILKVVPHPCSVVIL